MDKSGLWESTTVIISSDHYLRVGKKYFNFKTPDFRIPFILKMTGQKEAITYQPSFNTLVTHDLVLTILKKEVRSAREVVSWLNENGTNPINY